jgi:hypothetical protein
VTCNNASNNNVMIQEMARLLPDYSDVNRTHCFLHVVNLVAKSLLKQFDLPSKSKKSEKKATSLEAEEETLYEIVDDEGKGVTESPGDESDGGEDDPDDSADEQPFLTEEERAGLNESSRPVKLVLAKVRNGMNVKTCTYFQPSAAKVSLQANPFNHYLGSRMETMPR